MKTHQLHGALAVFALSTGVALAQGPPQPPAAGPPPQAPAARAPEFALAAEADKAIEEAEAQADAAAVQLDEALQQYEAAQKLEPQLEQMTAEVWKNFLRPVLASGQQIAKIYTQIDMSQAALAQRLKDAAAYYKAAEAKCLQYSAEAKHADFKKDYETLSEIWKAKAALAEERAAELEAEGGVGQQGPSILVYIEEGNLFILRMLEQVQALDFAAVSRISAGRERLAKHKAMFEKLRGFLDRYKEITSKKAFNPAVRDAVKKREADRQEKAARREAEGRENEAKREEKERVAAYRKGLSRLLEQKAFTVESIEGETASVVFTGKAGAVPSQGERLRVARLVDGRLVVVGSVSVDWRLPVLGSAMKVRSPEVAIQAGDIVLPSNAVIPRLTEDGGRTRLVRR